MLSALRWSLGVNAVLTLVKGAAAHWGTSDALLADAVESFNDVLGSLLMLAGLRYALRPADDDHPYGHGRAEPLLTFAAVLLLLISAGWMTWHSVEQLQKPPVPPAVWTLWVLGGVVLVKQFIFRRLERQARQSESSLLSAEAWHHRSDAISSGIAFVGIVLGVVLGPRWAAADDWAALLASGFIGFNAWVLFRRAFGEVMDEQVHGDQVERIRALAMKVEGVRGTEKCRVRKTGMVYWADLHLWVDGQLTVEEGHRIAHATVDHLKANWVALESVLVHVEPASTSAE
ncbi:cation diffusion facilitator family transporter [bacterium]|nr:cation diffusion facilitator family transporter [bacterium]